MIESQLEDGKPNQAILRDTFINAQRHSLEAKIHNHTKTTIGLNAYLTDAKGIVLFDSDNARREGQDLSQSNDVFLTLSGEIRCPFIP